MARDWIAWHEAYEDPESGLSRRLAAVRRRFAAALDEAPPGPVQVISMCAGEGRDVLGVLADHPRREEVSALLIEAEPELVERVRAHAARLDGPVVSVARRDAGTTTAYASAVPADVVLACGVFGNVSDEDIERTAAVLPSLCAPRATVIWTRGGEPSRLDAVGGWFRAAGFELIGIETGQRSPDRRWGVGAHRLVVDPPPYEPAVRMFSFRPERRGPAIAG